MIPCLPPISVSQANDFSDGCRWAFRETRLRKQPTPRPVYLDFGTIEHAAIQKYLQHCIATGQEMAPQAVPALWREFVAGYPEPIPTAEVEALQRMLEKFAGSFRLDLERVWKPEAQMAVDIDRKPVDWTAPTAFLRGIADLVLIDGTVAWLSDWKTGWVPGTEEDLRRGLQGRTYATLLGAWNRKIETVHVTFHFLRLGVRRSMTFRRQDMDETWAQWLALGEQMYAAMAERDDDKVWAPRPGPQCAYCEVAMACPLGQTDLAAIEIVDEESAKQVAEALPAVEAHVRVKKDRLKAWVKARGPMQVNGGRWDFYKSEGLAFENVGRVMALATKHFIEPTELVRVDTTVVRKLAVKNRPFMEALEQEHLVKDAGRVEFKFKKAGVPDAGEEG